MKAGAETFRAKSLVVLLFLLAKASYIIADYFLKLWTSHEQKLSNQSTNNLDNFPESTKCYSVDIFELFNNHAQLKTCEIRINQSTVEHNDFIENFTMRQTIYAYSTIIFALIMLSLGRSLIFFRFCSRASINIHDNLFRKIVRAPLKFFEKDSNQFQILNKFSKDLMILGK